MIKLTREETSRSSQSTESPSISVALSRELPRKLLSFIQQITELNVAISETRSSRKQREGIIHSAGEIVALLPGSDLARVITGVRDYFIAGSYQSHDVFISTRVMRWPDFRSILEGELEYLLGGRSESAIRCHDAIKRIHYNPRNIANPWSTGVAHEPLLPQMARQHTLTEVRKISALLDGTDREISGRCVYRMRENMDALHSILERAQLPNAKNLSVQLLTATNLVIDWLRPECYPLVRNFYKSAAELSKVVGELAGDLPNDLQPINLSDSVDSLRSNFADYLHTRALPFSEEGFFRETEQIRSQLDPLLRSLQNFSHSECTLVIDDSISKERLLAENLSEISELEQSRLGGKNGLAEVYGKANLRSLIEKPDSIAILRVKADRIIGFALLSRPTSNVNTPNPLDAAHSYRGPQKCYSLDLIVTTKMQKGLNKDPYREIMRAINDLSSTRGISYIIGWCREENRALMKHLSEGGEISADSYTTTDLGLQMTVRPLIRVVNPSPITKAAQIGRHQLRKVKEIR